MLISVLPIMLCCSAHKLPHCAQNYACVYQTFNIKYIMYEFMIVKVVASCLVSYCIPESIKHNANIIEINEY